jgi:hypothetical protein
MPGLKLEYLKNILIMVNSLYSNFLVTQIFERKSKHQILIDIIPLGLKEEEKIQRDKNFCQQSAIRHKNLKNTIWAFRHFYLS